MGTLKYLEEEIRKLRIQKEQLFRELKDRSKFDKISLNLRKMVNFEDFQKFFNFLDILQDKKKLEGEIEYLLDSIII